MQQRAEGTTATLFNDHRFSTGKPLSEAFTKKTVIRYSLSASILDAELIKKIEAINAKYQQKLQILKNRSNTLDEVEQEFQLLRALNRKKELWIKLTEEEKLTIEIYKCAIMKATQNHIRNQYKVPALVPEKPTKKTSPLMWFVFTAFLILELIPMIWGGFMGMKELLVFLPLSSEATTITSIIICGVETLIFYSMMGPMLKEALGISTIGNTKPRTETYGKQIDLVKDLDMILTVDNKMKAAEYEQYVRLANLFSEHVGDLKEHEIYVKKSFTDEDAKNMFGKAIIVVDNQLLFVEENKLLKNSAGKNLSLQLTEKEQKQLPTFDCDQEGKVKRTDKNNDFLNKIIHRSSTGVTLATETSVKQYHESTLKKGLQLMLSAFTIALMVGNGYFFGLYLITETSFTAGLAGTPLGWGIIGFIILGQLAMRLAIRSNAMFNMLNPDAAKHEQVRDKINNYKINTVKYREILTEKKRVEKLTSDLHQRQIALDKREYKKQIDKSPILDRTDDYYPASRTLMGC